ncbi:hypothetical protein J6590_042487 [Homalodisca vitripennis]|nr:hypothetical protein J6590_042487 [Homalodisca vitripennis]
MAVLVHPYQSTSTKTARYHLPAPHSWWCQLQSDVPSCSRPGPVQMNRANKTIRHSSSAARSPFLPHQSPLFQGPLSFHTSLLYSRVPFPSTPVSSIPRFPFLPHQSPLSHSFLFLPHQSPLFHGLLFIPNKSRLFHGLLSFYTSPLYSRVPFPPTSVFEMIILTRLQCYFDSNALLTASQFGFRKWFSTSSAVNDVIGAVLGALDGSQCIGAICSRLSTVSTILFFWVNL